MQQTHKHNVLYKSQQQQEMRSVLMWEKEKKKNAVNEKKTYFKEQQ